MRFISKLVLVLFCTIALQHNQGEAKGDDMNWKFTIDQKTIGVIIDRKSNKEIGSAFVAGVQKHVITCAHVATKGNFIYKGINLKKNIPLKSKYFLPKYDLSVFSPSEIITDKPLKFGDFKKIRPGDNIVYIGWDKNLSKMKINKAVVFSVGSAINNGVIVDFLEFQGVGLPGYSGGPVFDLNGNVIAIMREAWTKRGIKGGPTILMNRAFSVEILLILNNEVYSITDSTKESRINDRELKNFINIKMDEN